MLKIPSGLFMVCYDERGKMSGPSSFEPDEVEEILKRMKDEPLYRLSIDLPLDNVKKEFAVPEEIAVGNEELRATPLWEMVLAIVDKDPMINGEHPSLPKQGVDHFPETLQLVEGRGGTYIFVLGYDNRLHPAWGGGVTFERSGHPQDDGSIGLYVSLFGNSDEIGGKIPVSDSEGRVYIDPRRMLPHT